MKTHHRKNNKTQIWKLTLCGAPRSLSTAPNCVAKGVELANAYVGALDGIGNMVTLLKGSVSARNCTRNVSTSSGSIFTIMIRRTAVSVATMKTYNILYTPNLTIHIQSIHSRNNDADAAYDDDDDRQFCDVRYGMDFTSFCAMLEGASHKLPCWATAEGISDKLQFNVDGLFMLVHSVIFFLGIV